MEINHEVSYLGKEISLSGWSFSKQTFKVSKGGQYLVDLDFTHEHLLLLESFRCLDDIFSKKDTANRPFGAENYDYRVLPVKGLKIRSYAQSQAVFLRPDDDVLYIADDECIYKCKRPLSELTRIDLTDPNSFETRALPAKAKGKQIRFTCPNGCKYIQAQYELNDA